MYTIDTTNKKIIFTFSKSTVFEELKMTSALKAQQIITKEGTDLSDMYIITDGELSYLDSWLDATLPLITSSLPQQHLTTSRDSTTVTITAYTDTSRDLSEGNIVSADGILRNLLTFGCLAEWYSDTGNAEFQQEYAMKLAENIKLFAATLWDSRKRKVGTLFSTASGSTDNAKTYASQIEALQTIIAALQTLTAAQGVTIAGHTSTLSTHTTTLGTLGGDVDDLETNLANEVSRAQGAESGILSTVQGWLSDFASLKINVNGTQAADYTPGGENQTVSLTIPTTVAGLSDGSNYPTTTAVNGLIAAAIASFAGGNSTLATILADYATKAWVTANFSGGVSGNFVDLTTDQTIAGVKTFGDIVVTGTFALPNVAPVNPSSSLNYLWVDTNGNYTYGDDDSDDSSS